LRGASGDDTYEDSVDSIPLYPPPSPLARESSKFTHTHTHTERYAQTQLEWLSREEDKLEFEKMLERENERRQRAFSPNGGLRWVGWVRGAEL